jgi:hypothetical protein
LLELGPLLDAKLALGTAKIAAATNAAESFLMSSPPFLAGVAGERE